MSKMSDIDLEQTEAKEALEIEMVKELLNDETVSHNFTKLEYDLCEIVNAIIFKSPKPITAKEICEKLEFHFSEQQVRKSIQLIRRHNNKFNDDGLFLIAKRHGYWLTSNFKELKAFFDKTQHRYENTTPQLLQMRITLSYLEKEEAKDGKNFT